MPTYCVYTVIETGETVVAYQDFDICGVVYIGQCGNRWRDGELRFVKLYT